MKTIEDKIQEILAEHHECRWMDSSELENCLRRITTEQKVMDDEECMTMVDAAVKEAKQVFIDKACEYFADWMRRHNDYAQFAVDGLRKAMED